MKNIIKKLTFVFVILLGTLAFAAEKKSIVCTTFPEYDWIMNILGSKASDFDITLLQNNGTDLHSYQPSFKDIAKVSNSDLFVYIGGESDSWVEKALSNSKNKNQIAVNLMESLGDKVHEEEIVEGMQAEEEEESEEEETEYDEHIWLSVKNAIILSNILCDKISALDKANASTYKANTKSYAKKLEQLDSDYSKAVASAKRNTMLFADRFPFRYLAEDYNIKYYAAFVGCSAESEASFDTVIFLVKKVDELGLNTILTIERGNRKLAESIKSNSKAKKNIKIMEMDSLQSITKNDLKKGKSYISTMQANLETLKKALN